MDARYLRHALSCLVTFFPTLACGEALTDGTMGEKQILNEKHFTVPQTLGTLKGQNLFHSFEYFNIKPCGSATFTGDNAIRNVISRVTGNESSEINGKLSSKIGKADFYFINPNGVVFGQGAQIDVPAAFRVSTASEIRFPDGGIFSAANPNASTLSVEQPEAYGFLGNQSGHIRLELAKLNRPVATSVELVGRNISVNGSELKVPSGSVRLEAVGAGDAQVPVGISSEIPGHGAVTLTSSAIDVSGEGGGKIDVRAGSLEMDGNAKISGDTHGSQSGASIDARLQGNLTMSGGSQISSSAFPYSKGNAGGVEVNARELTIDGSGKYETGIRSEAKEFSSGNAGHVKVTVADQLSLLGAGRISSSTLAFSKGNAGGVEVNARELTIDGSGKYETGIRSEAKEFSSGNAGHVKVTVADQLSLLGAGRISSSTLAFSKGNAGGVEVNARELTIDGRRLPGLPDIFTGIRSQAREFSSGNAGDVVIDVVKQLSLFEGRITSRAFGKGDAGDVKICANELRLDRSIIDTEAENGNGGLINIDGGHLIYLKDSEIITSVLGTSGNAGNIDLKSKILVMETGFIQANATAQDALGGNIQLDDVDALIPSGSSLLIGGDKHLQRDRGRFGYNVIQAAAPRGKSGNIEVSDVQLDLSGSIASISTQPMDVSGLTQDFCGLGAGSSLIESGLSGGLPPKPSEGSFNLMGRDKWNVLPQ